MKSDTVVWEVFEVVWRRGAYEKSVDYAKFRLKEEGIEA